MAEALHNDSGELQQTTPLLSNVLPASNLGSSNRSSAKNTARHHSSVNKEDEELLDTEDHQVSESPAETF